MRKIIKLLLFLALMNSVLGQQVERAPLTLSIAIPSSGDGLHLLDQARTPHFHVILSNNLDKPLRIWSPWNREGYGMLSFEFTNDSGERSKCKKKDVTRVSRELAQTYVLQPHENLVLDVNFAKVKIWEGFPAAKPGLPPVSMQAILEIPGN